MDCSSGFKDEALNEAISARLRPQPIPKAIMAASRTPLASDFISQPTIKREDSTGVKARPLVARVPLAPLIA